MTEQPIEAQAMNDVTARRRRIKPNAAAGAPASSATGGDVFTAVSRHLVEANVNNSGLAAAAVQLAKELDDPTVSATAKAACARSLAILFDRLNVGVQRDEAPDALALIAASLAAKRGGK